MVKNEGTACSDWKKSFSFVYLDDHEDVSSSQTARWGASRSQTSVWNRDGRDDVVDHTRCGLNTGEREEAENRTTQHNISEGDGPPKRGGRKWWKKIKCEDDWAIDRDIENRTEFGGHLDGESGADRRERSGEIVRIKRSSGE